MTEKHILSLGAGVQSTAVYLLAMEGELHLDAAIFADTGDEPEAVYRHLEWLKSLNGPEIIVRSRGRISEDLTTTVKGRFAQVPWYVKPLDGPIGQVRRHCSKEYKVEVIDRSIRRDVLGLKPSQRIPKSMDVHQYFGISLDEARRSVGIRNRCDKAHFPLIDRQWTRSDCQNFLKTRVPHEVPRSACVFCPFHSDREWIEIKKNPEDWNLAVKTENALRNPDSRARRKISGGLFAHRSCVPLEQIEFRNERQFNLFTLECEGMCGV
jgi:hypothetical protein